MFINPKDLLSQEDWTVKNIDGLFLSIISYSRKHYITSSNNRAFQVTHVMFADVSLFMYIV